MSAPTATLFKAALIFFATTKGPRRAEGRNDILRQLVTRVLAKKEDFSLAKEDELQETLAYLAPTPTPGASLLLRMPREGLASLSFSPHDTLMDTQAEINRPRTIMAEQNTPIYIRGVTARSR